MRRPSLLILILVETLTLFCLSVLGDRVAVLVNLPTPLLLACAALGIIVTTLISYWKQAPRETTSELTFREVWQRLTFRRRSHMLFGPRTPSAQADLLMGWGIGLAFFLGVVGGIIRPYFTQSYFWNVTIGVFILISLVPVIQSFRKSSSVRTRDRGLEIFLDVVMLFFLYGVLLVSGISLGSLILYGVLWFWGK